MKGGGLRDGLQLEAMNSFRGGDGGLIDDIHDLRKGISKIRVAGAPATVVIAGVDRSPGFNTGVIPANADLAANSQSGSGKCPEHFRMKGPPAERRSYICRLHDTSFQVLDG